MIVAEDQYLRKQIERAGEDEPQFVKEQHIGGKHRDGDDATLDVFVFRDGFSNVRTTKSTDKQIKTDAITFGTKPDPTSFAMMGSMPNDCWNMKAPTARNRIPHNKSRVLLLISNSPVSVQNRHGALIHLRKARRVKKSSRDVSRLLGLRHQRADFLDLRQIFRAGLLRRAEKRLSMEFLNFGLERRIVCNLL